MFDIDEHSHQLKKYEGNYDVYASAKEAERAKWEEDYERQQEEIKVVLKFPGPVIAVSHDRWFMQRFGGKVWEIAEGRVVSE